MKSITQTLLPNIADLKQKIADIPLGLIQPPFSDGYFGGGLSTNLKQEHLDHNEQIKNWIPKKLQMADLSVMLG